MNHETHKKPKIYGKLQSRRELHWATKSTLNYESRRATQVLVKAQNVSDYKQYKLDLVYFPISD